MKKTDSNEKAENRITVEQSGAVPPCLDLDAAPGQCRGCFGWDHMMRAAGENGCWSGATVRCDVTGLTVSTCKGSGNAGTDR